MLDIKHIKLDMKHLLCRLAQLPNTDTAIVEYPKDLELKAPVTLVVKSLRHAPLRERIVFTFWCSSRQRAC